MERIIMHVDVNNAFLSWTALELLEKGYKYDIRNSYAIIGGDEKARKGIVLAKSMPAKKQGVKTAETIHNARIKCPALKVYYPNYKWYQKKSNELFKLLSKYTPDIEIASIDECYIDYTKIKGIYGNEVSFAYKIKDEIFNTLHFTVNIGIANNKLCAKMASDFIKPNNVHTLYLKEIEYKMYPLPIEDLYGVGKKTSIKLRSLGINSIKDLATIDDQFLYRNFKKQAYRLKNIANGIDNSEVISKKNDLESIGNEITLSHDVVDVDELKKKLLVLSEHVSGRIRREKKYAYVIAVIIKDNYFRRKSHQKKLVNATNIASEIYNVACNLLVEMYNDEPIRLIGIRLDKLVEENNEQISIFDFEKKEKSVELLRALDELKNKFGNSVINIASCKNNNIFHKE